MPFIVDRVEEEEEVVQPKKEQDISQARSIFSSLAKGLVKGTEKFGRAFGPLDDPTYDPNRLSQFLDEQLPTKEGVIERGLERGGELLPFIGTGGSSLLGTLLRTGGAAAAGTGARELGAPEWLADVAEMIPLLAPKLQKRISPTPEQQPIVDLLRRYGAAEEEIAPLLQSERKMGALSKVAQKGGKTERVLEQTKSRLGKTFEAIRKNPSAQKALSRETENNVLQKIQDKLYDMPSSVRNLIQEDYIDLVEGRLTGDKLINFYQDINANLSKSGGKLGSLKEPIKDALATLSPNLANDFDLTNKVYSRYAKIANKLKPSVASNLFESAIPLQFVLGVATGNMGLLGATGAEIAVKKVAREMLTNPRLVNLSSKLVSSLNQSKFAAANKIKDQMARELNDVDAEAAKQINQANFLEVLEP